MTATKDPIRHNPTSPVDALPVDVDTIRSTITRALEQGPLPRYEDLEDLEGLLRGHIGLLLPIAAAAIDVLPQNSVERDGQSAILSIARDRLSEGMGPGLSSAHTHVRQLAHSCRALLRYAEDGAV